MKPDFNTLFVAAVNITSAKIASGNVYPKTPADTETQISFDFNGIKAAWKTCIKDYENTFRD